uniref:Uncharacterized protein n=1 Tax=Octopus bimaculoides TaxID=37653 RepID=A0A0L8FSA9_OCTBM
MFFFFNWKEGKQQLILTGDNIFLTGEMGDNVFFFNWKEGKQQLILTGDNIFLKGNTSNNSFFKGKHRRQQRQQCFLLIGKRGEHNVFPQ